MPASRVAAGTAATEHNLNEKELRHGRDIHVPAGSRQFEHVEDSTR
jgi:hypothetical protein